MESNDPWLQLIPMHWYNARTGIGPVAAMLMLPCQPICDQQQAADDQQRGSEQAQDAANV
ncbi:hypothetical protein ABE493_07765 [Stenotrophomonas terrae]|uniref:hypothetical protein n=1 Tax=Stenotrophomonas terrae TaxID=405446 RepID=UPI00320A1AA1